MRQNSEGVIQIADDIRKDGGVARLAMECREGLYPERGVYGRSRVVTRVNSLPRDTILKVDQIICWRNDTRRALNHNVRTLLGYADKTLVVGEKLVCTTDHHWHCTGKAMRRHTHRLIAGTLWRVNRFEKTLDGTGTTYARLEDGVGQGAYVPVQEKPGGGDYEMPHFLDYGYALTEDMIQGSEWDHVLIVADTGLPRAYGDRDALRWWYTAITRASERVTCVLNWRPMAPDNPHRNRDREHATP